MSGILPVNFVGTPSTTRSNVAERLAKLDAMPRTAPKGDAAATRPPLLPAIQKGSVAHLYPASVGAALPAADPRLEKLGQDQISLSGVLKQRTLELDQMTKLVKSLAQRVQQLEDDHDAPKKGEGEKAVSLDEQVDEYDKDVAESDSWYAADMSCLNNVYSYCLERALGSRSRSPPCVIEATLSLLFLFLVQIIFSYGFFDAARLLLELEDANAYNDPVDISLFYPDVSVQKVPIVNVLAAFASFVVLALNARQDVQGLLLTICPFEPLLLESDARLQQGEDHPDNYLSEAAKRRQRGELERGVPPKERRPPPWLAEWVVRCGFLQIFWTLRATILPATTLLGSAIVLASCDSCVDVVLNSVAAAFILELDDTFYAMSYSIRTRERFEAQQAEKPRATSPISVRGGQLVIWQCASLVFILDFVLMGLCYLSAKDIITDPLDGGQVGYHPYVRMMVMVRGALCAFVEMHRGWLMGRQRAKAEGRGEEVLDRLLLLGRLLLYGGAIMGFVALVFTLVWASLEILVGCRGTLAFDLLEGLEGCVSLRQSKVLANYGMNVTDDDWTFLARMKCATLHEDAALWPQFVELTRNTWVTYFPFRCHVRMVWDTHVNPFDDSCAEFRPSPIDYSQHFAYEPPTEYGSGSNNDLFNFTYIDTSNSTGTT